MIDLSNIRKVYKSGTIEKVALDGITCTINRGEFVAIMGPSGSGKSTMMHIIGALDTPTEGTYRLDGQDVSTLSEDALADVRAEKIGFVFQSFNLLRRTTVLRNVIVPMLYAEVEEGAREERARTALSAVGLEEELYEHHTNQISGGQMQRVAIARALVNDPAIILADEPTGNLDTKTGVMVMETLRKLKDEQGKTIVLITHESEIARFADRAIMLRDGKIIDA